MIAGILILAVIALYAGWVIRNKIKRIRAGQFCDCGHCSGSCQSREKTCGGNKK